MSSSVVETHVSTLFFVGDRVFKLKKPVKTGFLDFTTVAAREQACRDEVRVNRRYAPDVYLGVYDIHGPDGVVCEHMVGMRRMPAERSLARLVKEGADVDDALRKVAHMFASVHSSADRSAIISASATSDAIAVSWRANVDEVSAILPRSSDAGALGRIDELARRYVGGRGYLFERRIAHGRVVEGHGDLQAADVFVLEDGPRVLDAIEFDERLRHLDGLADAAFLAMDLERLGRIDLANRFLAFYREFAGDDWPESLAHHYIASRALVRAKVAFLRHRQGSRGAAAQGEALLGLARAHLDRTRVRMILVGGLPGTGKSTLCRELGERLGIAVLRSDEVRKRLTHGRGVYDDAHTAATYTELLGEAGALLRTGESVILDASWSDATLRDGAVRVAQRTVSDLLELQCVAPAPLAALRIAARVREGSDVSDATPEVAARMRETFDPWPSATVIPSGGPAAVSVALAAAAVS